MATRTLTYVLLGRDALSPVAEKAGATVEGSFARVGKTIAMAGAAATASAVLIAGASIKSAVSFQSSMEKVHTQAGASQKDVTALSAAVLKLAPSTQQGPEALANALYHLKSVGMDNSDAMRALGQASNLAAVGGADLEETTNALAGAWRSGIRGAQSFSGAASTVNAIIGAGNMRMADFVEAIGTGILPSAKTFGLSLGQVGAALALMTDEGVPAVDAATRLRMSFSLLGAPSHAADKQLKTIGLSGLQLADAMRGPQGVIGAIQLLKDHLDKSGLSASQQAQVLSRAFGGGRSSSAILTMINNLDVLKKKQDQINHTTGKFGDAVAAQRKTVQAQFALIRSSVETLGIRLGTALLPPLASFLSMINGSGGVGQEVSKAFSIVVSVVEKVASGLGKAFGPTVVSLFHSLITFGSQLVDSFRNLLPAIRPIAQMLGVMIGATLIVSLRLLGTLLANVVGPALRGITGFIGQNKTLFGALAVAVGAVTTLMVAQKIATLALGVGMKILQVGIMLAWRAQALLDAAMAANPIGLVIAALIALAAAFAYAWTHSATFRKIVEAAYHAVLAAAMFVWHWIHDNWPLLLEILTGPFGIAVMAIVRHWTTIKNAADAVFKWVPHAASVAWNAISSAFTWMWVNILRPAISFLWNVISGVFGAIVNGAAKAFGWVPIIGGKLKNAANAFNQFRDQVNNAINGIQGKTVTVNVDMASGTAVGSGGGHRLHAATGGRITGPGGPRSDTAGLFALSNGEWVIQSSSSGKYGDAAMNAVNRGTAVIGYAAGGGVGVTAGTPSARTINSSIWNELVSAVKGAFASSGGSGGMLSGYTASGGVARWAGVILRVLALLGQSAAWLPTVERRMNQESGGNPYAINLWDTNATVLHDPSRGLMQTIMSTFLAYAGPFRNLGIYNPLANVYAGLNYALHTYGSLAALNRPGGYALGGPVSFDSGGWLPPRSATIAVNGTNAYERVGGGGGNTYVINVTPTPLAQPADVGREVVGAIREFEKRSGKGWRS